MQNFILTAALTIIEALILFAPEILPKCDCCGKIKLRNSYKYHISTNLRLSYKGNLSLCKKCCAIYNINSLTAYQKQMKIKKRMEHKVKWQL